MRHLFIINPAAALVKGNVAAVRGSITSFFKDYTEIKYDIFVTEWSRDAVSYIKQYVRKNGSENNDVIRIHAIGGTGLLFEVVNGVMGFDNVEVASHPYGKSNAFLKYFKPMYIDLFSSMEKQIFSKSEPMDVFGIGSVYGMCYSVIGLESYANVLAYKMIQYGIPTDLSFLVNGAASVLIGDLGQRYSVFIDGLEINGDFASIMIGNTPCYSTDMYPAVDAHPDDGLLDIYLFKKTSRLRLLTCIPSYVTGKYHELPDLVSHYKARSIGISSDETMCITIDGEILYRTTIEFAIIPKAVRFVLPDGIDMAKLPLVYNRPEEGLRGE